LKKWKEDYYRVCRHGFYGDWRANARTG
jgi:hypothetical protein